MTSFWIHPVHFSFPFWRAGRRLAPINLPFAPSPSDLREWNLEILPPSFTPAVPFPSNNKLTVSLHRLLIEVGIAQTLATTSWDPRSWYALYRYGGDFTGTAPMLRFYPGVKQKDPRLTQVMSEEVATGITCYLLREQFGLPHIADVYACLQNRELDYVDPLLKIRPDYFCQDNSGLSVIAESKGAKGTRSNITGRIDPEGWDQVCNVAPTNLSLRSSCGRVVIGTHFCVHGQHPRSETTTIIKDPKGKQSLNKNPDSDMVLRLAYAKCLRFMGQDAIAERLIARMPIDKSERIFDLPMEQIGQISFFPLGMTAFGDSIGFYGPIAKALFLNSERSIRNDVYSSLNDFSEIRGSMETLGYSLSNGVIVVHDLDNLMEDI